MLRQADIADIPEIVQMGARFHYRARAAIPYCRDSVAAALRHMIESPDAVVFIDGQAAAGAALHPAWFNHAHRTGMELFWWAENGAGRGLFDAMEAWAFENGADSFGMIALDSLRPETVGAIYRRRGYAPMEHSFLKVF